MKEIRYTIIYTVCENFGDSILLQFRLRNFNGTAIKYGSGSDSAKAKSYGSYGSGSATLEFSVNSQN